MMFFASKLDRDTRKTSAVGELASRFIWLTVFLTIVGAATQCSSAKAGEPPQPSIEVAKKPTFDNVGPQVGQQLPDLRLRTINGEMERLGNAWRHGPALFVTSSLTCPKSRSRWPELAEIAKKYGDKLNIAVVYVIEAHPVGSVCPYKGVEDITPENERDGILRKQPQNLEERLELAKEFKRYLRIDVPIYVDVLENRAWKALGAAPNSAFAVNEKGIVVARQGWFDGPKLQQSIDVYFQKQPTEEQRRDESNKIEERDRDLYEKLMQVNLQPWHLSQAIRDNDIEQLSAILKKLPNSEKIVLPPDRGHEREATLLMYAAARGNVAAAELLLKHGADIHARTNDYDSPLQAADFGNLEMVRLLLRHKADVNVPASGRTPLHEALIAGKLDAAKLLIEAGAKEDFYSDIALGKVEAVRKVLASDPSMASRPDGASRMPLDYAAANDQMETATLLMENGALVVDYQLSPTPVPLHYAIRRANVPMAALLLRAGHSPDTAEGWGRDSPTSNPAMHMAISSNQIEIVKLLLAYKADLKRRDTYSQMPLHYAAHSGKAQIVKLLIQGGADVKATTIGFDLPCGSGEEARPQHNTPLHFAAAAGNPETIKALLAGGAEIDAPNVDGKTPLMSAISPPIYTGINDESQLANIELLLVSGANVNARDKEGRTAFDQVPGSARLGNDEQTQQIREKALADLLKKYGAKQGK